MMTAMMANVIRLMKIITMMVAASGESYSLRKLVASQEVKRDGHTYQSALELEAVRR